ncbi:YIP1 family protein [Fictibacillus enclensis]|uniref:YIP1 family protein n=1 Tax=Fictibacillus enclensis TaxID=1017270 RepID=UPI0025A04BC5|nr:YIP1 family protein [Fictibacillus enclensis]MDM5197960.1 YIP1 family protein [Fictibacillus enclensis]
MAKKMVLMFIVFLLWLPGKTEASAPYDTYTINPDGEWMITQDAYLPTGMINGLASIGNTEGVGKEKLQPFSQPEDIFIDRHDRIYVADAGNGRIAVLSPDGEYSKSIGKGVLTQPTGVFVKENGHVFVADYGSQKLFEFDAHGKKVNEFGKPDSVLFGKDTNFVPKKVIVDKRGNLYAVLEGSVEGLAQFSPKGEFLGYFGANQTSFDLKRKIQEVLYTKEQLKKLESKRPPSASNLAIDDEGLIYTSTTGTKTESIKKLNISGSNLIPSVMSSTSLSDVTVDFMGNIYTVDGEFGYIYEYDSEGNLIFTFSGEDSGNQRLGLTKSPSGIAVNSKGRVFVLDKQRGAIQVFQPTAYANLVHKAMSYYSEGRYEKSEGYWQEVLKYNSMFGLAHQGMGMAALKKGNYEEALERFSISKDMEGYSTAYWEIRRKWMLEHTSSFIIAGAVLLAAYFMMRRLYRKKGLGARVMNQWQIVKKEKYISQFLQSFRIMRHPIDGYWELIQKGKGSVFMATILYILLVTVYFIDLLYTNFLFSAKDPNNIRIFNEGWKILAPIAVWIIANYLVSTINDGKGKLRDVYIGTAYAFSPYIFLGIPIAIVSNGLTLMESVLYDIARFGMMVWTALLMFLMVKEIHRFELGQTVKNILLTFAGMGILGLIGFMMFGLTNQLYDFVDAILSEVKARV